ncbi:MAG: hypothetical protein RL318_2907 [Fibrobacterota bacterium]|jgi:hypothetical protein
MNVYQKRFMRKITLSSMLLWSGVAFGQTVGLSGTVYSMYGNPLPNMVVSLDGAKLKTTTDKDGKYSFIVSTSISSSPNGLGLLSKDANRFLYLGGGDAASSRLDNTETSRVIYDVAGNAISVHSGDKQQSKKMAPGLYFSKENASKSQSSRAMASRAAALDKITVTFKDSLRGTATVDSYTGKLDIQITDKLFDRWPCPVPRSPTHSIPCSFLQPDQA